jgi:hypothetical protein
MSQCLFTCKFAQRFHTYRAVILAQSLTNAAQDTLRPTLPTSASISSMRRPAGLHTSSKRVSFRIEAKSLTRRAPAASRTSRGSYVYFGVLTSVAILSSRSTLLWVAPATKSRAEDLCQGAELIVYTFGILGRATAFREKQSSHCG